MTINTIETPISLSHKNIVPGTESIRVKGSQYSLIRDADYIIDYEKGELKFTTNGAAIPLGSLIEENGIDIEYSYRVNFDTKTLLESQIEVFDEVALYQTERTLTVSKSPICDIIRVFNLTTQETYNVVSSDGNKIEISGENLPKLKSFKKQKVTEGSFFYSKSNNYFLLDKTIQYPQQYYASRNPLISLDNILSRNTYVRRLINGGQDLVPEQLEIFVPYETVEMQLLTGGRNLKQSRTALIKDEDYSYELIPELQVTDFYKLKINLTARGQQKIRTNSLYVSLIFKEIALSIERQKGIYKVPEYPVNEVVDFTSNNVQQLIKLFRYYKIGEVGDEIVFPKIVVYCPNSEAVFEEGIDYRINPLQNLITKIPGGRIDNLVTVAYKEDKATLIDFTLVNDIILVDYIWGSNSLNWGNDIKQVPITEIQELKMGQQFLRLKKNPIDYTAVQIYLYNDSTKERQVLPISYKKEEKRLHIEPIRVTAKHVIEYVARSQLIEENTPYFVTYKYGAQRRAIENRYAKLMSLDNTQTIREEVFSLQAGTLSTVLSRSPVDLESIRIYNEDDPIKSQITTAERYDALTGVLYFKPLPSAGRKIFVYRTNGFDTHSLRNALQGLYQTFRTGPTEEGYRKLISYFTELEPEISLLTSKGFAVGDALASEDFKISSPLSDGSQSLTFEPARFNLGAYFQTSKGSYIKAPWTENLSLIEGTVEFLLGVAFEPNDGNAHYFLDIKSGEVNKNRLSIYKSKLGYLNFDIWDNRGVLYRSSISVNQVYQTEIFELKRGQTSQVLTYNVTPAQIDLNNNEVPDVYEGLETKFIITAETNTFPSDYLRQQVKVLSYDAPTRTIYFEPIDYAGRYVFSYVTGLVKYEETENFICATWKLHTMDGESPFYKLFVNGVEAKSLRLKDISLDLDSSDNRSRYDISEYDVAIYES